MGLFDKIKSMFTAEFIVLEGAPALTPEQDRALALGAVYAAEGHLPVNAPTMEADPATAQKLLSGAWDVHGPDDVDRAYAFLLHQGHRGYYALVAPRVDEVFADRRGARGLQQEHLARIGGEAAERGLDPERARAWYTGWTGAAVAGGHAALADPLPASIVAWDAARVVHLSRLLLDAGLVTRDRAFEAMGEAVGLSRPAYRGWEEFGRAFVVGRAFWTAGTSRNPVDGDIGSFDRAVDRLLKDDGSPWLRLAY
jgi:hypothetical protein